MIILLSLTIQSSGSGYGYNNQNNQEELGALNYTSIFRRYNSYQEDDSGDGFPQIITIGEAPDTNTKVMICDYFLEEYVCYTLNRY